MDEGGNQPKKPTNCDFESVITLWNHYQLCLSETSRRIGRLICCFSNYMILLNYPEIADSPHKNFLLSHIKLSLNTRKE